MKSSLLGIPVLVCFFTTALATSCTNDTDQDEEEQLCVVNKMLKEYLNIDSLQGLSRRLEHIETRIMGLESATTALDVMENRVIKVESEIRDLSNLVGKLEVGNETKFAVGLDDNTEYEENVPSTNEANPVKPCLDCQLEPGMLFFADKGYLKLTDQYNVGSHINITLSIKPRQRSGILVAVHGDRHYLILQLVNGSVKFTVDHGKGAVSSINKKDICDGNWHSIEVTYSRYIVTLAVDGVYSSPGIGSARRTTVNTNGPLFVGGVPKENETRGIETTENFVGCMRDFLIENRQFNITNEMVVGHVGFNGCPTT